MACPVREGVLRSLVNPAPLPMLSRSPATCSAHFTVPLPLPLPRSPTTLPMTILTILTTHLIQPTTVESGTAWTGGNGRQAAPTVSPCCPHITMTFLPATPTTTTPTPPVRIATHCTTTHCPQRTATTTTGNITRSASTIMPLKQLIIGQSSRI